MNTQGIRHETYIMNTKEFINMADNPIQRNTVAHAKKSLKDHHKQYHTTHDMVNAVLDRETNKMYKLDGHTRAYIWLNNLYDYVPSTVKCEVYYVNSIEEVKSLYATFDYKGSTETSRDQLYGILKDNGLVPKSTLVTHGGIISAIRMITGKTNLSIRYKFDIYNDIPEFMPSLKKIDAKMYSNTQFMKEMVAALILSVMRDGDEAFEFWDKFATKSGNECDGKKDGVSSLLFALKNSFAKSTVKSKEKIEGALSCYAQYKKGNHLMTHLSKYVPPSMNSFREAAQQNLFK